MLSRVEGISVAQLLALLDGEKDPFGRLYITTAIEDVRIDIGSLLALMSRYMGVRNIFPELAEESEVVRMAFVDLINGLRAKMGLDKVEPDLVIGFGGNDEVGNDLLER